MVITLSGIKTINVHPLDDVCLIDSEILAPL